MYISAYLTIIAVLTIGPVFTGDVCIEQRCQCDTDKTTVHCDTKKWTNLDGIDFPSSVATLTLIQNNLRFNTVSDRAKIENLTQLIDLSLNENPLEIIPPFNNTNLQFLSLQDASLTSAEFPSCYNGSSLQTITLNNNRIRSIKENDFIALRYSRLDKLSLDSASISTIDQNAFTPLTQLQSLSLGNNQLKSCAFLPNIPLVSSIKLDGNQFTSLPEELLTPKKIKTYSFKQNSISTIDESSPLSFWLKANYTKVKIYLANNPLNCCSSVWLIRLLKISPQLVADASALTCVKPSKFSGQFLIKLNPDQMDCSDDSNQSWWNANRIIGVITVVLIVIGTSIGVFFFVRYRRRRSRSGYTSIGGTDGDPYDNVEESGGPVFPRPDDDDDNDDARSIRTNAGGLRGIATSEAPTYTTTTNYGTYAADESHTGGVEIQGEVPISVIA